MLAVLSDTHGRDGPRLEGRTAEAVDAADLVIHAGDFVTEDVLDAFEARCDLRAVYGNNDPPAVRDHIPAERVVEWADLRIAVAHGHAHSETALSLFARQSNADLVVVGHSHRPRFYEDGPASAVPLLNPGSHADPRRYRPSHAELEWDDDENLAHGRLIEPGGEVFERFTVTRRPLEDG